MKLSLSMAVVIGTLGGFIGCCLLGRVAERTNAFENFARIHPFLEGESSYFPTASQLAATARAQCPPGTPKTLVIIGGNSVFNGSGQKRAELWSGILQQELGEQYHVINFSAPGAGIVDNGAVVFEMLSREYPRMVFVTNTEPGYYAPAYESAYSYLYCDAYAKGQLLDDPARAQASDRFFADNGLTEMKLGYGVNNALHFHDLWTSVTYRYVSTVWTSWLKERSFFARRRLPDWYDNRKVVTPSVEGFQQMLLGHLGALRRRKSLNPDRYQQEPGGGWVQSPESLREDADRIAALLPGPLKSRTLVVFTPINPWFLEHLTEEERQRVDVSFKNGVELLQKGGFHALSLLHQGFQPLDFGDTIHMSPAGGQRLARALAPAIRELARATEASPRP